MSSASCARCAIPRLLPPAKPRFKSEATIVGRAALQCSAQRPSAGTDPSVDALSTTTTEAGLGCAAASDSRHWMVSTWPFQFTMTTPIGTERMVD